MHYYSAMSILSNFHTLKRQYVSVTCNQSLDPKTNLSKTPKHVWIHSEYVQPVLKRLIMSREHGYHDIPPVTEPKVPFKGKK